MFQRVLDTKDTKDTKERRFSQLFFWSVNHTVITVPHVRNVEVQKQAQFVSCQFQVGQQLRSVNRKMDLVLKLQVGLAEFVIEAGVAGAFQDAGAERAVDFHRRADDEATGFVGFHRKVFP